MKEKLNKKQKGVKKMSEKLWSNQEENVHSNAMVSSRGRVVNFRFNQKII